MKMKWTPVLLALCLLMTGCGIKTADAPAETVITGQDIITEEPAGKEEFTLDADLSAGIPADTGLTLPQNSSEYRKETALALLSLCAGHTKENSAALLENAGFTVLAQQNFEKDASSPAHTCAYTVGMRFEESIGTKQFIITVRGTNGGEWYSNFDFAPSQSEETAFAENFLFSAQDVFSAVTAMIDFTEAPQIIVCGHSRGAACANLLGVLLDECYAPANVYVYTFATPGTVRPGYFDNHYDNIFNVINPGDVVPRVPLAAWGFARAGTDIIPEGDTEAAECADRVEQVLADTAPDILSYYTVRHSLTAAGEDENGVTSFEFMMLLSRMLSGFTDLTEENKTPALDGELDLSEIIADESDFAPLRDLLQSAAEDGGTRAGEVLTQHLPATYAKLLE